MKYYAPIAQWTELLPSKQKIQVRFLVGVVLLPFSLVFLSSCGYDHQEAAGLERQGMPLKAAEYYALFADKNPDDPRAPASLFEAAEIYARQFGLCSKAAPVLEKLLKNYPSYSGKQAALKDLLVCPDYLPVDRPLSWTFGDSDTGGRNARLVTKMSDWSPLGGSLVTKTYAGRQLVATQKKKYVLKGRDLLEKAGRREAVVMKYPVEKGLTWTSIVDGRTVRFTIEDAGLKVKVRAGEFENCIKVRQAADGASSWIYEYYAPWTGKILTSVAGNKFENRVTELIKYEERK